MRGLPLCSAGQEVIFVQVRSIREGKTLAVGGPYQITLEVEVFIIETQEHGSKISASSRFEQSSVFASCSQLRSHRVSLSLRERSQEVSVLFTDLVVQHSSSPFTSHGIIRTMKVPHGIRPLILWSCLILATPAVALLVPSLRTLHKRGQPTIVRPTNHAQLPMVFDAAGEAYNKLYEEEKSSTRNVLDNILDESMRLQARRAVMIQFDPSSKAIWRHWQGTVLSETWRIAVMYMVWHAVVYLTIQNGLAQWFPNVVQRHLPGFTTIWGQSLSITTFTLTFFVNQSFSLWRLILTTCRTLQGKCNDLLMILAVAAQRQEPRRDSTTEYSTLPDTSRDFLLLVARYIRLCNTLCYASFTKSHRPLLTPRGMRRMVDRGLLTDRERQVLVATAPQVPPTQRHNVVLLWILRAILDARRAGLLDGGPGWERTVIDTVTAVRAQANSIESSLRGRMPFAYAHVVQIFVDCLLFLYPFSALHLSLPMGMLGSGLLAIGFRGLFDLSKQFLDPFHNENFWAGNDALLVDTILAETNGASIRWAYGIQTLPMAYRNYALGNFTESMLPNDGYSVEEATARQLAKKAQEEKERQQVSGRPGNTTDITPSAEEAQKKLEEAQDEFEETLRILNTPPGYDAELETVNGDDDDYDDNDDDGDAFTPASPEMLVSTTTNKAETGYGADMIPEIESTMESSMMESERKERRGRRSVSSNFDDFLEASEEEFQETVETLSTTDDGKGATQP